MRFRRVLSPLACAAAVTAAACGAAQTSSTPSCSPVPSTTPAPPHASEGAVTVSADRGIAPRGGTLQVTVVAIGPAAFSAPCTGPVSLVVSDATGLHVLDESPAAQPGDECGAVHLGSGASAAYRLTWSVDPTLPSGPYTLAVTVGDLPEVSVGVEVGGGVGGAPQC